MTAASRIRASVEALSPYDRRWGVIGTTVMTGAVLHKGIGDVVARCRTHDTEYDPAYARHIALLASPDVATALADLLDALSPPAPSDTIGGLARIVAAKAALEAAISKGADN